MSEPVDLELTTFHVELPALERCSVHLHDLGMSLKVIPSMTATPDPTVDTASLAAARQLINAIIPGLQGTISNHFIERGYLMKQAATRFQEHDRYQVITGADSLLPPL